MAELDPTDPAALADDITGGEEIPGGEPQSQGFDPFTWLAEPVHGDLSMASWENIFSPQEGGWNRLALVLESAFDGPGMPRFVHLIIAAIEIMILAQQEGTEAAIEDAQQAVEPAETTDGVGEWEDV